MISQVGSPEKSLCPSRGIKQSHLLDQLFTWGKRARNPYTLCPALDLISGPHNNFTCTLHFVGHSFHCISFYFWQSTGASPHKTQASYSNGVAIGWERNCGTAWEVVKPSSETVQSKRDARTQNERCSPGQSEPERIKRSPLFKNNNLGPIFFWTLLVYLPLKGK